MGTSKLCGPSQTHVQNQLLNGVISFVIQDPVVWRDCCGRDSHLAPVNWEMVSKDSGLQGACTRPGGLRGGRIMWALGRCHMEASGSPVLLAPVAGGEMPRELHHQDLLNSHPVDLVTVWQARQVWLHSPRESSLE